MSVVAAVQKGTAKEEIAMHLLRSLWFFTAHYDILNIEHIAGVTNLAADQLSRCNMQPFFSCHSQASALPTPLPPELLQIVAVEDRIGYHQPSHSCSGLLPEGISPSNT